MSFNVGDVVRRRKEVPSEAYEVRHTPFEIMSIEDVAGHLVDPNGQHHHHGALELLVAQLPEPEAGPPESAADLVNHPPHYTSDPSGVECITITRHRNFNIGSAIKYLWRQGLKSDASLTIRAKQIEDLRKAVFYINDEIARLEADA